MNAAKEVKEEWTDVALAIADRGFHVLQPDFHSNPKTAPGGTASPADFALAVRDLLGVNEHVPRRYQAAVPPKALLLGKSWGAGMALSAALELPRQIVGLGLVVPAVSPEDPR